MLFAALQAGGFLGLETDGHGQGERVAGACPAMLRCVLTLAKASHARRHAAAELLAAMQDPLPGGSGAAFERIEVSADYAGVRRFVTAWRAGG